MAWTERGRERISGWDRMQEPLQEGPEPSGPVASIIAPFGVREKNKAAPPPGLDGSRLLWYTGGDLRAACSGVETCPRLVLWSPPRAFLF